MKTELEIKKMKDEAFSNIQEINERIARTNSANFLIDLALMKAQYQAQYSILLEILK